MLAMQTCHEDGIHMSDRKKRGRPSFGHRFTVFNLDMPSPLARNHISPYNMPMRFADVVLLSLTVQMEEGFRCELSPFDIVESLVSAFIVAETGLTKLD